MLYVPVQHAPILGFELNLGSLEQRLLSRSLTIVNKASVLDLAHFLTTQSHGGVGAYLLISTRGRRSGGTCER